MTHFEEIKQMNVDELANWINNQLNDLDDDICFKMCEKSTGNKFLCPHGEEVEIVHCKACVKKWFESEVEDKK